ncbi:MAG: hypothetical protein AAFV80_08100 [Bacteroidota bacterium]
MNNFEIIAGERLGEIAFGMSRNALTDLLGPASEVEAYAFTEANLKAEDWHYDEHEISVSFEEASDWTLSTIASSSPECHFMSLRPIGMSEVSLIEALEALEIGEVTKELFEDEEGDETTVVRVAEAFISFWIVDDEVTDIELRDPA